MTTGNSANGAGRNNIDLGPGTEFDLVRTLLAEWGKAAQRIGDDAAVLDVPKGELREGASAVMCPIVGGDLSSGRDLSLTITALGSSARPLTRSGAKAGQRVYVTGRLGGPASAIRAWRAGKEPTESDRARFANPVPRIEPAIGLAERGATAGIDISDGLIADLGHVAAASKVSIEIDADQIPRVEGVSPTQAASSGEEYEIVVTAPEIDTRQFSEEFGLELTEVGRVVAGRPGVTLLQAGKRISAQPGFDHFRGK